MKKNAKKNQIAMMEKRKFLLSVYQWKDVKKDVPYV